MTERRRPSLFLSRRPGTGEKTNSNVDLNDRLSWRLSSRLHDRMNKNADFAYIRYTTIKFYNLYIVTAYLNWTWPCDL